MQVHGPGVCQRRVCMVIDRTLDLTIFAVILKYIRGIDHCVVAAIDRPGRDTGLSKSYFVWW